MNKLVHLAAAGSMLAAGALGQDLVAQGQNTEKMKAKVEAEMVQLRTVGAVRGSTLKGAPYSAEEVNESNQMLADGTRIHRESRTQVYRDSEGRTRRETPDNITITDPVANVTYLLNPKTMTGQKLTMAAGNFVYLARPGVAVAHAEPAASTFSIRSDGDGPATITVNGVPMDEKQMQEMMAKAKASGSPQTFSYERKVITHDGGTSISVSSSNSAGSGGGGAVRVMHGDDVEIPVAGIMTAMPARAMTRRTGAGESLGKQTVEGVMAEGMREVSTIPEGTIGNDRPIRIVNESWYSEELQMMVSSKRSDPRTGDEVFRMTNIRRGEPGAYLFQAPSGYQISEPKRDSSNR